MKQNKYFMLAAAAALFAACSSDDALNEQTPQQQTTAEVGVGFDVYTQRGITRAGAVGDITSANLKDNTTDQGKAGFGVFGYYTDNNEYDQQSIPNFMYNEQVTWDGTNFTYAPVKYWPNEYGTNAESDDVDKLSFFAYAPWVEVVPSTGKLKITETDPDQAKWGITGLTRNSATGDPLVKYIASFEASKCVDLCWGVVGDDATAWKLVQGGETQPMTAGKPWIDVKRPYGVDQRMKFTFNHALTQLNVQIDADPDIVEHNPTTPIATGTKVYVRSVTFSGFTTKGTLNLNNTEAGANVAYWLDYSGNADLESGQEITIFDGLKDGKEGTPGATAANEKTLGLNADIISNEGNTSLGVTAEPKNLFTATAVDAPVLVIPTNETMQVTIVYDIETADENLSTYLSDASTTGSSIENRITKTVTFGTGAAANLQNGKKYTLKLHLGMNSVKFDADVTDWVEADAQADADLPSNLPAFAAAATATPIAITLPAGDTKYQFAITGLDGGEGVTPGTPAGNLSAPSSNPANSSGVAVENVTIAPNLTVNNVTNTALAWKGDASTKGVELTITQQAHVLGLSATGADGNGDIILSSTATDGDLWTANVDATDAARFIVKKNGVTLTYSASTPTAAEYGYSGSTNTITLGKFAQTGDTFSITIQAGDAPAETYVFTIG